MLNAWSGRYPNDTDLIITQCMTASKFHMYPTNMYNDYISRKIKTKTKKERNDKSSLGKVTCLLSLLSHPRT